MDKFTAKCIACIVVGFISIVLNLNAGTLMFGAFFAFMLEGIDKFYK